MAVGPGGMMRGFKAPRLVAIITVLADGIACELGERGESRRHVTSAHQAGRDAGHCHREDEE